MAKSPDCFSYPRPVNEVGQRKLADVKKKWTDNEFLTPYTHKAHAKFITGLDMYVSETAIPLRNLQEYHLRQVKTLLRDKIISMSK